MTPRENALIAYRHGTPEWIPCFMTDVKFNRVAMHLERDQTRVPGAKDAFGVPWIFEPGIGDSIPMPNHYLLDDITKWREKVHIPDVDTEVDWEAEKSAYEAQKKPEDADKLRMCMIIQGMFERLHSCMGFNNALEALMLEPEACYEFFGAIADYKIAFIKKLAQHFDFDALEVHDDYGSQDRLFMSPETWRTLIKPHLQRIVDATHACGMLYQHHSCGHIEPLTEEFIALGMDAVDTWQAASNPHVAELKKRYGDKLTFVGGFDNTHVLDNLEATPEQIQAEYRRAIDALAPGGSYVIFPITGTFGFVPAFLEEHFRYGMSFYKNPANR